MAEIDTPRTHVTTAPNIGVGEMRTTASHIAVLLALDDTLPEEILVSVCKETGIAKEDVLAEWAARMCPECGMSTRWHHRDACPAAVHAAETTQAIAMTCAAHAEIAVARADELLREEPRTAGTLGTAKAHNARAAILCAAADRLGELQRKLDDLAQE